MCEKGKECIVEATGSGSLGYVDLVSRPICIGGGKWVLQKKKPNGRDFLIDSRASRLLTARPMRRTPEERLIAQKKYRMRLIIDPAPRPSFRARRER